MGFVKGVKNVFGRKQRKARRARAHMDALQDPLNDALWEENPAAVGARGPRVNPLADPAPAAPAPAPVVAPPPAPVVAPPAAPANAFAAKAARKRQSAGSGKSRLKDRHVGEFKQAANDVNDSAHEVRRVDYKREIGTSGTNEGFFKPVDEDTFHGSDDAERTGVGAYDATNGDAVLERPNLIARSVANTRLDERLGLNTVAHEYEAKHGGEIGVVSGKVAGVASHDVNDIDYSNPETQRSVANIEAFDYLTNQQDRHGGNIYVDRQTGTAHGIDNDLSFGRTLGRKSEKFHGLPKQVDAAMAERILGLGEDELDAIVAGQKGDYQHLSQEERDAAVERLLALQAHIGEEDENGRRTHVVDEWNDDTFQRSLEGSDYDETALSAGAVGYASSSMLARMHYQQEWRRTTANP